MSNDRGCPRSYAHGSHTWTPFEMGELPTNFGAKAQYTCPGSIDGLLSASWEGEAQLASTAVPPCTLDVQLTYDHELEFHFDVTGHVIKVICSCGKEGTVEML